MTSEYEQELNLLTDSASLNTDTAGKMTIESDNSIGHNKELFQVYPEIAYGQKVNIWSLGHTAKVMIEMELNYNFKLGN